MKSLTSRDLRNALIIWASMGLQACGLVDAIDDATGAQVSKITGPSETCTDTYTMDMQTGKTDTTTVCEAQK